MDGREGGMEGGREGRQAERKEWREGGREEGRNETFVIRLIDLSLSRSLIYSNYMIETSSQIKLLRKHY